MPVYCGASSSSLVRFCGGNRSRTAGIEERQAQFSSPPLSPPPPPKAVQSLSPVYSQMGYSLEINFCQRKGDEIYKVKNKKIIPWEGIARERYLRVVWHASSLCGCYNVSGFISQHLLCNFLTPFIFHCLCLQYFTLLLYLLCHWFLGRMLLHPVCFIVLSKDLISNTFLSLYFVSFTPQHCSVFLILFLLCFNCSR